MKMMWRRRRWWSRTSHVHRTLSFPVATSRQRRGRTVPGIHAGWVRPIRTMLEDQKFSSSRGSASLSWTTYAALRWRRRKTPIVDG